MEVKPVGPERDIQIAELKGLCWHKIEEYQRSRSCYTGTTYKDYYTDYYRCNKCNYDDSQKISNPLYSTSLTDCWPLWEEMKKAPDVFSVSVFWGGMTGHEQAVCHIEPNIKDVIEVVGEDELDAISGAWVKWKGEDNG